MGNDILLFIPYQDLPCFFNTGILTREYSLLQILYSHLKPKNVVVVNKPRTTFDQAKLNIRNSYFPKGSYENEILTILESATQIWPKKAFSFNQAIKKRGWWSNGYLLEQQTIIEALKGSNVTVYSNNPFASKLIANLKNQQRDSMILWFDAMDNLCSFPNLRRSEKRAAYVGYQTISDIADFLSTNSTETGDFFLKSFGKETVLIKNGVFPERLCDGFESQFTYNSVLNIKKRYDSIAGFIGKLGKRIDVQLIKDLSDQMPNCAFILAGPELDGQCSEMHQSLDGLKNVFILPPIPSAYLPSLYSQFDYLMLPYSVGENENSGDPLKLYQCFLHDLPIACTPIAGVNEYGDTIHVSNNATEWKKYFESHSQSCDDLDSRYREVRDCITWESRVIPALSFLNGR